MHSNLTPRKMIRTTIILPSDIHEELRHEAFLRRVSLSRLITERLIVASVAVKKELGVKE